MQTKKRNNKRKKKVTRKHVNNFVKEKIINFKQINSLNKSKKDFVDNNKL